MAENSFPFYGEQTSETEFTDWVALFAESGVADGLNLTAGAGMAVNVSSGRAGVAGRYYENTSSKSVTVSAAPPSGTRKDAIILRLNMAAKTIIAVAKDGTTAGGGTPPTLQTDDDFWEVLLGYVSVASGTVSITNPMIQQVRPMLPIPVYAWPTVDQRPSPADAFALGVDTTTKRAYLWTGAAWGGLVVDYNDLANKPTAPPAHTLDSHDGLLSVTKGGTGAATAADARTALGVPAANDASTITGGTLNSDRLPTVPIAKGGTGATTKQTAREALGIFVRSSPLTGANATNDIRLW